MKRSWGCVNTEDSKESSARVIVSISVRILLSIIRNAGTEKLRL